ncbi:hypothetical protein ACNQFN_11340 [Thauera butanivorans]|uniref:hypothetical protein n=1 Tax=Thauera butanivorans TaxID=86174 RepID=UPI003AB33213
MDDPFKTGCYGGIECFAVTANDRINRVKTFDRAQCQTALAMGDLQKSVERAVRIRLRQLDKQPRQPAPNPQDGMTVVFEDHGQDFLKFDIKGGRVIDARPFQSDMWSGAEVINETIHRGDHIALRHEHSSGVRTIRYPIDAVLPLKEGE